MYCICCLKVSGDIHTGCKVKKVRYITATFADISVIQSRWGFVNCIKILNNNPLRYITNELNRKIINIKILNNNPLRCITYELKKKYYHGISIIYRIWKERSRLMKVKFSMTQLARRDIILQNIS